MGQSLARNLLHLVFSTKDRRPFLKDELRTKFHEYAAGIFRDLNSTALLINSVEDHVHVLFNLHRTKALSDVVMELKRSTSKWVKEQGQPYQSFYWQSGFGAFSVSQSDVEAVLKYIAQQAEHHRTQSFQDEFRLMLRDNETEFDERYVWD